MQIAHEPLEEGITLGGLLKRASRLFGGRTAYVVGKERVTFAELDVRVDAIALALLAEGVARGDKVAIWMPNRLEWVLFYLATVRLGAAVVPVNTSFTPDEAAYVIGHSDAKVLAVGSEFRGRDTAQEAVDIACRPDVHVRSIVVADDGVHAGTVPFTDFLRAGESVLLAPYRKTCSVVRQEDLALLLYTSGTTGLPKGAMHSHKVIYNMRDAGDRMALCVDDTVVLYLPLFHVFAAAAVISFMHAGASIVLMPSFDAGESLRLIEAESATVVYGMHTMYYDQLHHPEFSARDLSSVRFCLTPGTGDLVRAVSEHIAQSINVYGMTETTSVTTLPALDDPIELRADTVGLPLPGFEVKTVDKHGSSTATGVSGEIVVRGHPVMLGYYKQPDATAEAFTEDGWFRTGDAGNFTSDGYLCYHGRIKDMVKVGGENVDPAEVEAVLMRYPGVAMAAVVGEPDDRLVEVVVAYVKMLGDAEVSVQQLVDHCATQLARFKVPRRVYRVSEFPKTASGKIKKFQLSPALMVD